MTRIRFAKHIRPLATVSLCTILALSGCGTGTSSPREPKPPKVDAQTFQELLGDTDTVHLKHSAFGSDHLKWNIEVGGDQIGYTKAAGFGRKEVRMFSESDELVGSLHMTDGYPRYSAGAYSGAKTEAGDFTTGFRGAWKLPDNRYDKGSIGLEFWGSGGEAAGLIGTYQEDKRSLYQGVTLDASGNSPWTVEGNFRDTVLHRKDSKSQVDAERMIWLVISVYQMDKEKQKIDKKDGK